MDEFVKYLLGAAGGGLTMMWGMLLWTNGRIRRLEMHRVTPEDCIARHITMIESNEKMWREIGRIAEGVARIEGYLGTMK